MKCVNFQKKIFNSCNKRKLWKFLGRTHSCYSFLNKLGIYEFMNYSAYVEWLLESKIIATLICMCNYIIYASSGQWEHFNSFIDMSRFSVIRRKITITGNIFPVTWFQLIRLKTDLIFIPISFFSFQKNRCMYI